MCAKGSEWADVSGGGQPGDSAGKGHEYGRRQESGTRA